MPNGKRIPFPCRPIRPRDAHTVSNELLLGSVRAYKDFVRNLARSHF